MSSSTGPIIKKKLKKLHNNVSQEKAWREPTIEEPKKAGIKAIPKERDTAIA